MTHMVKIVRDKLNSKNPFLRKSAVAALQIPRLVRRLASEAEDYLKYPPVICNSFPKSGTHLLKQILEALPEVEEYGTLWATMPSLSFKERTPAELLAKIHRLVPGELVSAHLFYREEYHRALAQKNAAHFFIFRDPRDCVISEAHYLTFMNRWHRMHRYYRELPSPEERISLAITGSNNPDFPYSYPSIAERYKKYLGWLHQDGVLAVKFEELISERRKEAVRGIVKHYLERSGQKADEDLIVRRALTSIDPSRSRTFRNGRAGGGRMFLPRGIRNR